MKILYQYDDPLCGTISYARGDKGKDLTETLKVAVTLGAALVLAGVFSGGGLFTLAGTSNGTYVLNKYTGRVLNVCYLRECYPVEYSK